ncbi:MAG: ABC transporter permease [Flavobacterium sp.]|nr:ABC transporter permease [Flavobacterium sp.]
MNFSFYIAKRYTASFSKNTAINIITGIASLGIIAGTMALFVVLSAFSGLRDLSLESISFVDPDLKLFPKKGKTLLLTPQQEKELQTNQFIAHYSKVVEDNALFSYNQKTVVANLKGVDSVFTHVSAIDQYLYVGNWLEDQTKEVIVGSEISRKLSLGLFDYTNVFEIYSPKPGKGTYDRIEDAFLITSLQPTGIFNINEELDSKYVYCSLDLAQQVFQLKPNEVSSLEFKLRPNAKENEAILFIEKVFKEKVVVKNRTQLNDALYKMLNTENIVVYLIFTLVIIIALFNLIGALVMIIIDKKNDLKTLYYIGNPITTLRKIFLFQGLLITGIGCFIGLILGSSLILLQEHYSLLMISPNLPYPVLFEIKNILIVVGTISVLGFSASFLASRSVNKSLFE